MQRIDGGTVSSKGEYADQSKTDPDNRQCDSSRQDPERAEPIVQRVLGQKIHARGTGQGNNWRWNFQYKP